MKTIYKYPLDIAGCQKIVMPTDAKILCVQTQIDIPCLWALVERGSTRFEKREFVTLCTGHHPTPDDIEKLVYIGTVQMCDESLVFHVFERLKR
jgi:hypothetical protein